MHTHEHAHGKTERNILIAFLLNLSFSVFELFGGFFTHSVAILSDSVHDLGDAISIGLSYFLERKSTRHPDARHTHGYRRYSVLGSLITTVILLVGSVLVIIGSVSRLIHPVEVNYHGMILFAVVGVALNLAAAVVTREGDSLNQKAVNLHMLEDVLGWIIVLIGSVVMNFTDLRIIDPLMSIGVSVFIAVHAFGNLSAVLDLFLEKVPDNIAVDELAARLNTLEGVEDIHHLHVWSLDGESHRATLHAVVASPEAKCRIREELKACGISHATIETERPDELCAERECAVAVPEGPVAGHHHHHHGHG